MTDRCGTGAGTSSEEGAAANGALRVSGARIRLTRGNAPMGMALCDGGLRKGGDLGSVVAPSAVASDITVRRHAEESLQLQARLLDAVGQAIVATDVAGYITYWNRAAEDLYGWPAAAAVGRHVNEIIPSDATEEQSADMITALVGGRGWSGILPLGRRDGSRFLAQVADTPVRDTDGLVIGTITVSQDVTEREEAKAAADRLAQQVIAAQRAGGVGSWEWDVDSDDNSCSAELHRILGLGEGGPGPSYGDFLAMVVEEDRPRVHAAVTATLLRAVPLEFDARVAREDGTVRWLEIEGSLTSAESGRATLAGTARDVTLRRFAEAQVQRSEQRYRRIVETALEGIWILGDDDHSAFANARMAEMLGTTSEAMAGVPIDDFLDAEGCAAYARRFDSAGDGNALRYELPLRRIDGTILRALVSAAPLHGDDLWPNGWIALVTDITERYETEAALSLGRARLAEAERTAQVGSWEIDARSGEITWSDEQFRQLGYAPGEVAPSIEAFLARVVADDRPRVRSAVAGASQRSTPFGFDARVVLPTGRQHWLDVRCEPVFGTDGRLVSVHGTTQNVTRQKGVESDLSKLALYDALTGLPNRSLLADRLATAQERVTQDGGLIAVLFVDLDRFKLVNDTRGHGAGDALLCEVGARLQAATGPTDTVARFGGDEFVVVCEDLADEAEADAIAERITEGLRPGFDLDGTVMFTSASIGIAIGHGSESVDSLLSAADAAMYCAKEVGRGRRITFDSSLRARAADRFALENELRSAMDAGAFRVAYQPVVALDPGRIVGAEALVRWDRDAANAITTTEFVALAEDLGLIGRLGEWVLGEACRQLRTLADITPELVMSVNVSAHQLAVPDFPEVVKATLESSGISADRLVLEVTETVLMEDVELFHASLRDLQALGVGLAMDDFGTGFSSLAYLQRFPLDTVKVDQAFVEGVATSVQDRSLVTAVLGMVGALGMRTHAEGVETHAQLACLRELGCELAQGFLFAQALPADEFTALLRSDARW